ncbi:MAG: hypothetical protein EOM24_27620 [Chloroflexia bacterium]|nr:hypothetical protein [Chloroflexia bacterium]
MYFGQRRIRSAGRTSGSVEVTLPPQLQALQEIECRLMLRDGATPEIIIQPDLSVAYNLLQKLWSLVGAALAEIDEIGDFDASEFTLALMPPSHWQRRPPLAYVDALVVLRQGASGGGAEALARLVACMSIVAGYRLGLSEPLALAFGDVVAYLVLGVATQSGLEYERGLAQQLYGARDVAGKGALDPGAWTRSAPGLRRVWEQFEGWHADPASYTSARQRWYLALNLELGSAHAAVGSPTMR